MISIRRTGAAVVLLLAAIQVQALNILLTNDDGYQHPWINAVRETLVAAGHRVTLVAPARNQSGQSAALTLATLRGGDEGIQNPKPGIYAIEGTPATAVILGVTRIAAERPDLVVSGTNDGANVGVLSSFSGTVGATVAALQLVGEPIPAIAISADRLDRSVAPGEGRNIEQARHIAAYLAELIADLEASRADGEPLLPSGIALNINYPAVPEEQVKGAGIFQHGRVERALFAKNGASEKADGEDGKAAATWDTTALKQGYITIVPIDGDYTAPNWDSAVSEERLGIR